MDLDKEFDEQVVMHYDRFYYSDPSAPTQTEVVEMLEIVKSFLDLGLNLNTPKFQVWENTYTAAEVIFEMFHSHNCHNDNSFLTDLFEKYKAKATFVIMEEAVNENLPILQTLVDCGGDVNYTPEHKMTLLEFAIGSKDFESFKTLLLAGADMHALTRNGDQTIEQYLYSTKNVVKFVEFYEHCGGKALKAAKSPE